MIGAKKMSKRENGITEDVSILSNGVIIEGKLKQAGII